MSADFLGFNPDFLGPQAAFDLNNFAKGAGVLGASGFGEMLGGPAAGLAFGVGALGYTLGDAGLPVAGGLEGLYGLGGTGFSLGF